MVRTLTTLDQLAPCNAGLMSVHYCPELLGIAEDAVMELVHPDLQPPFLQLLSAVEKLEDQNKDMALVAFAKTTVGIAAESKDREEFDYIRQVNLRTFQLWKTLTNNTSTESLAEEQMFYRRVSAEVCQRAMQKWHEASETAIVAMDVTAFANTVYEAIKDGSYWSDELYDRGVEMTPNGKIQFVGKENITTGPIERDEWQELFEDVHNVH